MIGSLLFTVLYLLYFLAAVLYACTAFSRGRAAKYLTRGVLAAGFLCHTIVIGQRWWLAGRPPMANMFETLLFFGWTVVLLYLVMEMKYGLRWLGLVATMTALLSLAYATLVFPGTIEPLMPALQNSFWLTTHVSVCFLGYGALAVAYVMALVHLLQRTDGHRLAACYVAALSLFIVGGGLVVAGLQKAGTITLSLNASTVIAMTLAALAGGAIVSPAVAFLSRLLARAGEADGDGALEQAMHRTVVLGFVFLSIGIATGSVWAQEAWGRYWGWDPKETWSLITWLIYGMYLHVRLGWNRKGVAMVWFVVLGFWAVVFTYFGVNFLLAGLHSYA